MDPFSNLNAPTPVILLGSAIALLFYVVRRWWTTKGLPYPPGPPSKPLIGNLRQIPKVSPWLIYADWKKKYGDVISVAAFGTRIVVVNSAKAASELFEKRGAIYSERPHNVMIHDLMKNRGIVFQGYTNVFRMQRKLMNAALNPSIMADYIPVQERETYALLGRLLDSPDMFYKHLRRTAGSIVMTIGYGHTVTTDDDFYVKLAEETVKHLRPAIQPALFLVNIIPALKYIPAWMPFAGFHSYARKGLELNTKLREVPFEMVKSQMRRGEAPVSYTSKLLEAKNSITSDVNEENHIMTTAATLYGAGSDTTVSSIMTFILAMVLYPEIQKKGQAELDAVIGNNRLPTISDKDSLPYLNWILSEVFRWNPVAALGVPHATRENDVYEGYFIPKGAVVLGNVWAMLHDEKMYPDPMRFWPERFDGRFPNTKDPRFFAFGFGRRLCPGRHLAINSVFIAIACLLSTYNFSKVRDAEGKEVEPVVDYSLGPPKVFECRITPRSKDAVALIQATQAALEL